MRNEKRCIKYPSIEQFRSVVSNINRHYNYIGLDENGDAIYDQTLSKPILKFTGTIKLHGTNAGVSYNGKDGLWAQSRSNIITPQRDNAGFAFFVESNKNIFEGMVREIALRESICLEKNNITIYSEWVGKSIQKGVGISNLEKSCFIFGVKISPFQVEEEEHAPVAYWVDHLYLRSPEHRIYNIGDYQTFEIDIDFNMPQLVQNELTEITMGVESECPISKEFGFPNTIGEGVVWSCDLKGVRHSFKIKGVKHSSSKVKTLASVDVEKLNSINEFVEYAVTKSRFDQALENVFPNNEPINIKKMGDVIRWVVTDVTKEEMDTMVKNKLEPKDVNKFLSGRVREMFFKLSV